MKCPYCSKDMAVGYIYNGSQPLEWIPDGEKPAVFKFTSSKDGVKLQNEFSLFKTGGYAATAHYCADCGIVIARTE